MLPTAREHTARSRLIAQRAVREASRVQGRGLLAVATVVITHQSAQAQASGAAVGAMLAAQGIEDAPAGVLSPLAFTTSTEALSGMLDSAGNSGFDRLVESLVQAAGRAAESVATAIRPRIGHVRNLTPPSCSRCAVLAGRVYRYSDGFKRHPNCDCTMVPVREGDRTYAADPRDLLERGQLTGLSKADQRALSDGADFNKVVNVRLKSAGLQESGRVLARAGRMTPEGIYRVSSDRIEAVDLLKRFGYFT